MREPHPDFSRVLRSEPCEHTGPLLQLKQPELVLEQADCTRRQALARM